VHGRLAYGKVQTGAKDTLNHDIGEATTIPDAVKGATLEAPVPEELAGMRLDKAMARMFDDYSRAAIQQWIRDQRVTVNGHPVAMRDKACPGQVIAVDVPPAEPADWVAQEIPLDILYEDEFILVVNKPAGLVVHPGSGNPDSTLLNALLHHDPALALLPRAGLVHRIDKDTTGLLVVARNELAVRTLVAALQARTMGREYLALIQSVIVAGGTVDAPIGRHSRDRVRMAVTSRGKPAVTHYRVEEKFRAHTLVRVFLETGRTHQIRVHMAYLGHPIVGDPVYGTRLMIPAGAGEDLAERLRGFKRQALHAETLRLQHPATGESMSWTVPVPEDMQALIDALRHDRDLHGT
jgi:23S rRNA pseudouridine1911/1915/1917 synthase